ncbi:hypothetical protein PG984_013906 [Apiospora sp. TS-2023a]
MAAVETSVEDIPTYATACSARFQDLVDGSASLKMKIQGLDERIEDERDRFEMFIKNSGAARTGRSSLQYRLREASAIRNRFVGFLQTLARVLDIAIDVTADMQSDEAGLPIADDIEELDGLVSNIARIITSLLKCSATIRNPHPHDRFSLSAAETDTTHFHVMDIAHVQEKFNKAPNSICERLSQANSYRRQYFRYREARHVRLERGTSVADDGQSTIASSIPQALKDGDGPTNESGFIDEDLKSESGQTQTTIAIESGRLPPLPAMSERGPFECPYCYTMIAVTTSSSWERHILRDLRCYICLHDDCPQVTQQFERRHDWIQHMREKHWRLWHCPAGCDTPFTSWRTFVAHMSESHGKTEITGSTASRTRTHWISEPCPLCGELIRSAHSYQRHIGRHQVDLALFALPNVDYDELLSRGSSESTSSSRPGSVLDDSDFKLAFRQELEAKIRAEADESTKRQLEELERKIRREAEEAYEKKMFEMAQEERARAEERAIALDRAKKEIGDVRGELYEKVRRELEEEARRKAEGRPPKAETKLPDWGESPWQEPTEEMTLEEMERSKERHQALQKARKEIQEAREEAEKAAREAIIAERGAKIKADEERVKEIARAVAQAEQEFRRKIESEYKAKYEMGLEARDRLEKENKAAEDAAAAQAKAVADEYACKTRLLEEAKVKAEEASKD